MLRIIPLHLGATDRQKEVAHKALNDIKKKLNATNGYLYCKDFIRQITTLEPTELLSSSLTGLKLIDDLNKGHEIALGSFFHSESLYTLWREKNLDAMPYFFTQRDMCTICDSHVCHFFKKNHDKVYPFYVISARQGNSLGRKSVDSMFLLKDGSWTKEEIDKCKIHYDGQDKKIQRYFLPDLYSNKIILVVDISKKIKEIIKSPVDKLLSELESMLKKAISLGVSNILLQNYIDKITSKEPQIKDNLTEMLKKVVSE